MIVKKHLRNIKKYHREILVKWKKKKNVNANTAVEKCINLIMIITTATVENAEKF